MNSFFQDLSDRPGMTGTSTKVISVCMPTMTRVSTTRACRLWSCVPALLLSLRFAVLQRWYRAARTNQKNAYKRSMHPVAAMELTHGASVMRGTSELNGLGS